MAKIKSQFTGAFKKSGKWYIGWVEEIPGVNTQGKTLKEAKENLKEALELTLEVNRDLGPVSSPKHKIVHAPIFLTR